MSDNKLTELTKWPTDETGMSVDLMLRIVGADTQRLYLEKWRLVDTDEEFMRSPLYHAMTQALIGAVGLMHCLRMLREADPERADRFAREYWGMCDSGDSFGEMLWEFTEEAGLDPELIKLAGGNQAAMEPAKATSASAAKE
jgi:hypothetical protein